MKKIFTLIINNKLQQPKIYPTMQNLLYLHLQTQDTREPDECFCATQQTKTRAFLFFILHFMNYNTFGNALPFLIKYIPPSYSAH